MSISLHKQSRRFVPLLKVGLSLSLFIPAILSVPEDANVRKALEEL